VRLAARAEREVALEAIDEEKLVLLLDHDERCVGRNVAQGRGLASELEREGLERNLAQRHRLSSLRGRESTWKVG